MWLLPVILIILQLPLLTEQAHAKEMTFDEALALILQNDTRLQAKRARLSAAEANVQSVSWHQVPNLIATGSWSATMPAGSSSALDSRSMSLTSSVNLYQFGGGDALKQALLFSQASEKADYQDQIENAEDDAVKILTTFIESRLQEKIANEIETIQGKLLDIAQKRYSKGLLPSQEVDKLRVDLSNAIARSKDSQLTWIRARADLQSALAKEGDWEISLLWPWMKKFQSNWTKLLKPLWQKEKDADYQRARALTESQNQRVRQSWSRLFPSLDATGSLGLMADGSNDTFWSVGLSLSFPIFNRMTDHASYRAASFSLMAAEAEEEQVRRTVTYQWQVITENYDIALATAREREKTVKISRSLYSDNLKRFQQGRISANDLAIDQQRLSTSEFLAISAWSAVHQALSRLCHGVSLTLQQCFDKAK